MPGFRGHSTAHLAPLAAAVFAAAMFAAIAGFAAAGCSDREGAAASQANASIAVQTSQLSVVVENNAGLPLTNVDVAIIPVGRAVEFSKLIGRMENAEKRDITLSDFHGRDGTTFNLRVVRPQKVRVTAKDLNNKDYNVEFPWR